MPPNEPPMEVVLDLDRVTLGRSESNDIVLPSPQVSSLHLVLKREGEGFRLLDQGSTNGTRVNGREVDEVNLADGDEILIGTQVAAVYAARAEEQDRNEDTTPLAVIAPTEAPAPLKTAEPKPTKASAPRKPAVVLPSASPGARPAGGGGSAPTVVIRRSAGASVPPARPPIKIAKPMPPASRKPGEG